MTIYTHTSSQSRNTNTIMYVNRMFFGTPICFLYPLPEVELTLFYFHVFDLHNSWHRVPGNSRNEFPPVPRYNGFSCFWNFRSGFHIHKRLLRYNTSVSCDDGQDDSTRLDMPLRHYSFATPLQHENVLLRRIANFPSAGKYINNTCKWESWLPEVQ